MIRPALAALVLAVAGRALAAAEAPPHVVLVLVDDLGWGDFGCFGNREARTPHVDRLAAEGLRFEQFYVAAPICSPSRVALTTGQYPQRWRIGSYLAGRAENERRGVAQWLDPRAPTLARRLRAHGYATGHFGKWHMGGQRDVADAPPISAYGFDAALTNFEGLGAKLLPLVQKPGDPRPERIWEDALALGGPVTWMQRPEISAGFVTAALEFLEAAVAAGRPAYVNVWPDDVHTPLWPARDAWRDDQRGKYRAVLEGLDREIGRLCDRIRTTPGLAGRTLVLVCSDNGPEPGCGSAGPFRGAKTTLYEGGIRSPLVVWGPGIVAPDAAGTVNTRSVLAALDLVPSLAALAGAPPAADEAGDGEDLSAVLRGTSAASRAAPLFWRRPPDRKSWPRFGLGPQPDLAMRDGRWKLLCDYDGGAPQLYDLEEDRGESRDRAADEPAVVARLTAALLDWHQALPPDRGPALGAGADRGR